MITSFMVCLFLFNYEMSNFSSEKKTARSVLIVFLAIQNCACKIIYLLNFFIDILTNVLASYYKPFNINSKYNFEKYSMLSSLLCLHLNSIIYLITFGLFIVTYRRDLRKIIEGNDEKEIFVDIEDGHKNIL
jgi:hypothetical protein